MAVFLHDLAKGKGGDHSILGSKIAGKLCPWFGFSEDETDTVKWLIRWHLLISKIAFRYDLNDPKTIQNFSRCSIVRKVKTPSCSHSCRILELSSHHLEWLESKLNEIIYESERVLEVYASRKADCQTVQITSKDLDQKP